MSEVQSQPNQQNKENSPTRDAIYIGKKPLMAYVTSTLIQLANQPSVTIKARGLSIGRSCGCISDNTKENGKCGLCYR